MSDKRRFFLVHAQARQNAVECVRTAPDGWCVEVKPRTRSLEQNSRLWAALADISRQIQWPVNGVLMHLPPEDWKDIFTASLRGEMRFTVGTEGGQVLLGQRTSRMTVKEMSDLLELINSFAAKRGIELHDEVATC